MYSKDGKCQKIAQSNACMRYVGSLSNLYPDPSKEAVKAALIDEIMDSMEDVISGCLGPLKKAKDDSVIKELMSEDVQVGKLKLFLDKLTLRLEENAERGHKNGYFVGDSVTIADIKVFGHFRNYLNGEFEHHLSGVTGTTLKDYGYDKMIAFVEKMENDEKIKKFVEEYDERIVNFEDKENAEKVRSQIYDGKLVYASL